MPHKLWYYTYDDENQLTSVATDTYYTPAASRWKSAFTYDGRGRLRKRVDYTWNTYPPGSWQVSGETRYVYDGMLAIQERNSGNTPTVTYTRGLDLSGTLQESGGIGGLLARSHGYSAGAWNYHNFYQADAGGNITAMANNHATAASLVAQYRYDPFGRIFYQSGTLASANVYRFSSKAQMPNSGLYYYGFRFYDPLTQRWLNRDPMGEYGGLSLYGQAFNDPVNLYDPDGQLVPFIIGAVAVGGGIYLIADWALGLWDNQLNLELAELENSDLDRLIDAEPNDIDPDAMQRHRRALVCLGAQSAIDLSKTPGTFHNGPPDTALPPFGVRLSHVHADAAANLTGQPGYQRVSGYFRADGTYVAPYYRRFPRSPMAPPDNHLYPRGR